MLQNFQLDALVLEPDVPVDASENDEEKVLNGSKWQP